jgi:hypothetical protein
MLDAIVRFTLSSPPIAAGSGRSIRILRIPQPAAERKQ